MHTHTLPSSLNTYHTSSFMFQKLQSWMFFHWVSVLWNLRTLFTQNAKITLISHGMIFIFVVCFQAIALGIITKLTCFGKLASFFFFPMSATFSSQTLVPLSSTLYFELFVYIRLPVKSWGLSPNWRFSTKVLSVSGLPPCADAWIREAKRKEFGM